MLSDVEVGFLTQVDPFARLLGETLSDEAQALLAAGHPLSYVAALFPFTEAAAEAALVARLYAVADCAYEGQVLTFMEHVGKLSGSKNFSQVRMVRTFGLDGVLTRELAADAVEPAVGSYVVTKFNSQYLLLARVVQVLGRWLVGGDAVFTDEQLVILGRACAFWFAVLDFDWKW